MACFPLMIELEGKRGLIIGGGKIALHKIKVLLPFGVSLTVVSEGFCDGLLKLAEENAAKVTLIHRSFEETDIESEDVCFVVAATDDEKLQSLVSKMCRDRHIPINVVDVKEKSSFYFPAIAKQEDLVVAVSTGGNSPVAAGYIKDKISEELPAYYGKLVEKLGMYRDLALSRIDSYEERKHFFRELLRYGEEHNGELPENVVMKKMSQYERIEKSDTIIK